MLGLVAAQLKHKVENKDIKSGKAVWVDVSILLEFVYGRYSDDRMNRLAVEQGKPFTNSAPEVEFYTNYSSSKATILKLCRPSFQSRDSSTTFTSSICLHPYVMLPASVSSALDGRMSPFYARMRDPSVSQRSRLTRGRQRLQQIE